MGVRVWLWKDLGKEVEVETDCEEWGGIQQGAHVGYRRGLRGPLLVFPVGCGVCKHLNIYLLPDSTGVLGKPGEWVFPSLSNRGVRLWER